MIRLTCDDHTSSLVRLNFEDAPEAYDGLHC
jgi:hypothetical protein